MSRQLSYQRSSLLKRSQRTSELAEITPKATLLLLLVLQVTQVELPGQAGLQLTLQEAFTEQLCYFQPRGESSASCRDASIATKEVIQPPHTSAPRGFSPLLLFPEQICSHYLVVPHNPLKRHLSAPSSHPPCPLSGSKMD